MPSRPPLSSELVTLRLHSLSGDSQLSEHGAAPAMAGGVVTHHTTVSPGQLQGVLQILTVLKGQERLEYDYEQEQKEHKEHKEEQEQQWENQEH